MVHPVGLRGKLTATRRAQTEREALICQSWAPRNRGLRYWRALVHHAGDHDPDSAWWEVCDGCQS